VSFTIGKLAQLTGALTITIRFYERKGLLSQPKRTPKGYRMYDHSDVERLKFIRHCRKHGFSLEEIKKLLELKQAPDANCGVVDEILDRQIKKLDESIRLTIQLRDELEELRKKCPHNVSIANCGIMNGLINQSECPCFDAPLIKLADPPDGGEDADDPEEDREE
jgi:DNA-binding transcriptional MerR regulator